MFYNEACEDAGPYRICESPPLINEPSDKNCAYIKNAKNLPTDYVETSGNYISSLICRLYKFGNRAYKEHI